jgi:hypothetical protein
MASVVYPKGLEGFLDGSIDWDTNTIKCVLIDTGAYTYSAAHDNLDDVAAGSRIGTPQTLASKTVTNGVADAADVTFTAVTGASVEAIVIWKDTGVESTSRLIAYIDGLSVTPNGGDIQVSWDNGSNKIFAL